jgi:hypothetical protein
MQVAFALGFAELDGGFRVHRMHVAHARGNMIELTLCAIRSGYYRRRGGVIRKDAEPNVSEGDGRSVRRGM